MIDGFEESEAIVTVDILRRAGVQVTTAGIGKRKARGSHQIEVTTDREITEVLASEFDAIVLPGGPGTPGLNAVPGMHARLRRQAAGGKLLAAICAAPSVLAAAGLLEGKRAACYPGVEDKMAGAQILRIPVAEDGNIITSRGVGTVLEFALAVVARLAGEDRAEEVAKAILLERVGV